jgi:hypothetical protein
VKGTLAVVALLAVPPLASAQTAELRGRVVSGATGEPVAAAVVSIAGVGRSVRTDSLGAFTLGRLPTGDHELLVQALGYAPVRATVPLAAGPPLELDVELEPLPPVLERVVTEADADAPRNFNIADFDERRAMGLGRFLTRAELLRDRGRSLDAVLRARVPGIRYYTEDGKVVAVSARAGGAGGGGAVAGFGRNPPRCYVNVIVDGVLRYAVGTDAPLFDLRSLEVSMIAGIEYYTVASLPVQFNFRGSAPCGTLVIWLQN